MTLTPKEKAEELVDKYCIKVEVQFTENSVLTILRANMYYDSAKQCALIAVEEMLASAGYIWGGRDTETGLSARDSFRKYWQEVKQEIEQL